MNKNKTITLNAQMVISRSENGVDLVQVLPDNPCEGLLKKEAAVTIGFMKKGSRSL